MKLKMIFAALLMAICFHSNATVFTLVIATTDSAYAHYVTDLAIVDSDKAAIVSLGSAPTAPTTASADGDYNTYVSDLNSYDSSLTALQDSLATHLITLRAAEMTVLTSLGYGTGDSNICSDQWVKVQGASFTTAWIGFSKQSTYLSVVFTLPTKKFPLY